MEDNQRGCDMGLNAKERDCATVICEKGMQRNERKRTGQKFGEVVPYTTARLVAFALFLCCTEIVVRNDKNELLYRWYGVYVLIFYSILLNTNSTCKYGESPLSSITTSLFLHVPPL